MKRQLANSGKHGVSMVSGSPTPVVGEKNTYHVAGWYEDTPYADRDPEKVTWELFKKRSNGKFTSTNIKKIGDGTFTFGEISIQNTYRLEAYLHKPEGGGLIINPKSSTIPKIGKVELHYVDDKKGDTSVSMTGFGQKRIQRGCAESIWFLRFGRMMQKVTDTAPATKL